MEQVIKVEPRTADGKGGARKLRKSGKLPGILYGHKEKPLSFSVEPRSFEKAIMSSGFGRNTVLRVQGLEREVLALVRDSQIDPVRRSLVHVDLIEVKETEDVEVEVSLEFTGKPVGVTKGGLLQPVRRTLRVATKPTSIPKSIAVDVTNLDLNHTIHVSDITLPAGMKAAIPGHMAVVIVAAPEKEEEVAPKPEAAAAAAAGGAAAAPAAGGAAAAPAAGAAAAKPAAEKKADKK
ncbi:MAG: 50S ribosomal protein L25 [Myxococcota bacterium]